MKQRMSRDLTARRYYEMLASGMSKEKAAKRLGILLLNFYGIDFVEIKKKEKL